MDTIARRQSLATLLKEREGPVTGAELATVFGVSRQVIVQDVAVLRAQGEKIMATPQGYIHMQQSQNRYVRTLACQHTSEGIELELALILDNGGIILDVVVEHQIYGELKAPLMIRTRRDLMSFMEKLRDTGAKPLSHLTGGIHLHTIEAASEAVLDQIESALSSCDLLCENIDRPPAID
jgi:hypothetical protein